MSYATKLLIFNEFVEYFLKNDKKKAKQYEEEMWGDDIMYIYIQYKGAGVEDDLPYMCNMLWREEGGEWKSIRYNGSSPFAAWFGSNDDMEEEEESE